MSDLEPNLPQKMLENQNVLQGYLLKHSNLPTTNSDSLNSSPSSSSSSINLRKKRWFLFNSENGKLYYYRTKEDLFPLGEIDINQASFVLNNNPIANGLDSFRFEIRSGVKQFILEANSHKEGFHWIRTLQNYRQKYFQQLNDLDDSNNRQSTDKTFFTKSTIPPLIDLSPKKQKSKEEPSKFYCDIFNDNNDDNNINTTTNTTDSVAVVEDNNIKSLSNNKNGKYSQQQQQNYKRTQSLPPNKRATSLKVFNNKTNDITNNSQSSILNNNNQNHSNNTYQHPRKSSSSRLFGGMFGGSNTGNRLSVTSVTTTNTTSNNDDDELCSKCRQSNGSLIALRHDKMALEDEVKTNREVIKILQEQLRIFNSEKPDSVQCSDTNDPQCDDLIALKIKLNMLNKENDKLKQENLQLKNTKQVLEEMLESRDRTLVSLTHEVYDLECKNSRMQTHAELEREFIQDEVPRKMKQKIEQLEDTAIAFEQQNYFLNKEIIELNEIRRILELKLKQSDSKLCEVEAKASQIQSKLLALLKEINDCIQLEEKNQKEEFHGIDNGDNKKKSSNSFVTNESVKQLVSRLLEESSLDIPLSWKPGNNRRQRGQQSASGNNNHGSSSGSSTVGGTNSIINLEYDELGFYHRNDISTRCYDFVLDPDKNQITWRSKWDHFISNLSNNGEIQIGNPDLKQMIRLGVPQDYRCKIWRSLIHQRVKEQKLKLGEQYYDSLLRNRPTFKLGIQNQILDPSAKQIELDLLRTLPNNRHFENLESDGIERLRRVLLAYSVHNQSVGYCQGLNRLAAVALLFMPEEDAFWCLVAIVEYIMPKDYYGRNLLGAHVDQYVLRDLISDKLPQLSHQMDQYHIEMSLFAWFLTIFVDNVPVFVYLHIWDVFLHEGSKVLFRFALAILKMYEQDLLKFNDSASMNQFLRTLDEKNFNLQRLSDIAFRELNPFPSRLVRSKRIHYTALVVEELKKIDEFRNTLNNNNNNNHNDDNDQPTKKIESTTNSSKKSKSKERTLSFDESD